MNTPSAPRTSFTFKLDEAQQILLTETLLKGNYRPVNLPYTQIAVEAQGYRVALYTSGKCLVQGKQASDFVQFVLEPQILGTVGLGYEKTIHKEHYEPHLGVDESGKGDFFGPLVIAAAYADEKLVEQMQKIGVRDSKRITSDRQLLSIADKLRSLLGKRFAVVRIGPAKYNQLYTKMKSVNRILSWGHARALENLLTVVPDCTQAVSDQFGNPQQVLRALMKQGRKITLTQQHRAESDPAVAAASILARADFLNSLKDLGEKHGLALQKGASATVVDTGVKLVTQHGPKVLLETAKCHFRTTDKVLEKNGMTRAELGPDGQTVSKSERPN